MIPNREIFEKLKRCFNQMKFKAYNKADGGRC